MKIDNCIRIIDGALQTTPSIDAFERLVFESNRVLRGDCFIDVLGSHEATQEALNKGAYAIISTCHSSGLDEEIAWIHVASIEQMLIKLLRYTINEKSLRFFLTSPIQASFLTLVHTSKMVKVLNDSLVKNAVEIFKAKENDAFCMSDEALIFLIAPSAAKIEPFLHVNSLRSKGLFLSNFSYREYHWHEQKIPALFVPEFLSVLAFCDAYSFAWQCDTITLSEHFYPQFITQSLRKKEFGTSDRVLIFETEASLLEKEIAYLEYHFDASSIRIYVPQGMDVTFTCKSKLHVYTQPSDLEMLKECVFQYALILGEKEVFEPLLNQAFMTQPTLF